MKDLPAYVLPKQLLEQPTPTVLNGVAPEVERSNRVFMCQLLNEVGMLLKLPQSAITTAQIVLHRFLHRKSLTEFRATHIILGSMFLSTKIEEARRSPMDICRVLDRVLKKRHGQALTLLGPFSKRSTDWQEAMTATEIEMLKELGFLVYVDHPHRFLLSYIRILQGSDQLAQRAWNFLNDSMREDLVLRFQPETLAASSIFLAARIMQVKLPVSPPWWELFDVKFSELLEVSTHLANIYTTELRYQPVNDADIIGNELLHPDVAKELQRKTGESRSKKADTHSESGSVRSRSRSPKESRRTYRRDRKSRSSSRDRSRSRGRRRSHSRSRRKRRSRSGSRGHHRRSRSPRGSRSRNRRSRERRR